jgi:hypothetical protein
VDRYRFGVELGVAPVQAVEEGIGDIGGPAGRRSGVDAVEARQKPRCQAKSRGTGGEVGFRGVTSD